MNIHNIAPAKITIIRNGLDVNISKIGNRSAVSPSEILYAGKVSKDKGIYELLNALKTVKKKGYDFKLKMAGTISASEVHKIKVNYGRLDIEILGEISFGELQKLYATCTMGIIPSLHEQCSYVAIEMGMFGVPMIVSNVDALGEMFEHEKTALLVPMVFDPDFGLNADTEIFADHIIRLITDDNLRKTLSWNVRKLYEEEYTLETMIENTVKRYRELW